MLDKRIALHTAFVLLLPMVVAIFGLSFWTALVLVLLALLWRWAIVLTGFIRPAAGPELLLETISASHFVEKVRWCMDRLGLAYEEVPWCGTIGAFYLGRTVPLADRQLAGDPALPVGSVWRHAWCSRRFPGTDRRPPGPRAPDRPLRRQPAGLDLLPPPR